MIVSPASVDSESSPSPGDVELLVNFLRLSRLTLLYDEAGSVKTHMLQCSVMPLLHAAVANGKAEVTLLFDAWQRAPLAPLLTRIDEAVFSIAPVRLPNRGTGDRSLVNRLAGWQETLGVTFLIILDRFEEYLAAPLDRQGVREFDAAFVQAVNEPSLRANFLLSMDADAEPLLARFRGRVPGLGDTCLRLRLPRSKYPIPSPLTVHKADDANVPLPGRPPSSSPSPAEFTASAQKREQWKAVTKAAESPSLQAITRPDADPDAQKDQRFRLTLARVSVIVISAAMLFSLLPAPNPQQPANPAADRLATQPSIPGPAGDESPKQNDSIRATNTRPDDPSLAAENTRPTLAAVRSALGLPADAATTVQPTGSSEPKIIAPETSSEGTSSSTPGRSALVAGSALVAAGGPMLYIHVRDQAQRARAERMISPLALHGIRVTGIKVVSRGPSVLDLRYFRPEERDEAAQVARALREIGIPTQRLKQIAGFETRATPRQYELWLPPA